jgi:hypothetical protein
VDVLYSKEGGRGRGIDGFLMIVYAYIEMQYESGRERRVFENKGDGKEGTGEREK